jgi:hypothetical protein
MNYRLATVRRSEIRWQQPNLTYRVGTAYAIALNVLSCGRKP